MIEEAVGRLRSIETQVFAITRNFEIEVPAQAATYSVVQKAMRDTMRNVMMSTSPSPSLEFAIDAASKRIASLIAFNLLKEETEAKPIPSPSPEPPGGEDD